MVMSLVEQHLKNNHIEASILFDIKRREMGKNEEFLFDLEYPKKLKDKGYEQNTQVPVKFIDSNGNRILCNDKLFAIMPICPYKGIDHLITEATDLFFKELADLYVQEILNIGIYYMTAFALSEDTIPIDSLFNISLSSPKEISKITKFQVSLDSEYENGFVSASFYSVPKRDKAEPTTVALELSFTALEAIAIPIKEDEFCNVIRNIHSKVNELYNFFLTTEFKDQLLIQDTLEKADGEEPSQLQV